MAKSFRLQFVDIDSSYTINTTEAAVKGYITVRAPKGTTEAMYFNYGNEKAINAMIGLPTANWIDLYEAVAFNQEYGLYISAPAGTGADYPSYYGGVYLTTRGSFDYWQVSDAEDPSFEICINPGSEPGAWGMDACDSKVTIEKLSEDYDYSMGGSMKSKQSQGLIKISNLSPAIFSRSNYFNLRYWGHDACSVDAGVVSYKFEGTPVNGKIYYVDPDDGIDKNVQCGIYKLMGANYTIWLGGDSATLINGQEEVVSNNMPDSNAPWLSFKSLFNYDAFRNTAAGTDTSTLTTFVTLTNDTEEPVEYVDKEGHSVMAEPGEEYTKRVEKEISVNQGQFFPFAINGSLSDIKTEQSDIEDYIKKTILSGLSANTVYTKLKDSTTLLEADPFMGISGGNRIEYRVNIKDLTFCRVHQKSPNETPTVVEIKDIGYDKWRYDQQCAWIDVKSLKGTTPADPDNGIMEEAEVEAGDVTKANISKIVLPDPLKAAIMLGSTDGLVMVVDTSAGEKYQRTIFQLETTTGMLVDVTNIYMTQRFYINGEITSKFENTVKDVTDEYTYTIWEIATASIKGMGKHTSFQCTETSSAYPLKKNVNFNSLTVSCKEIVYPGEYTSGGEFTGSLSETGTDSFGSNIYWPNILPEETVTFIEVVPVNTFDKVKGPSGDDVMNDQGFFTGTKIVDPIGPAKDLFSTYLKGQRYCTHINELNQADGLLGCTWRDEYFPILKEGLIEAQSPDYDDALVFMEPSGYEEYKPLLMSLRVKYHDTSTIISPKIITKAQLMNPNTITVSGRSKGTAQYIGEFKKYDTYTGKNYYCQPIGDVGLQLARIMDKKLGGIAPAGTNDSQGLGGCLARPVLSAKWKFSDEALEILDRKGLCAITYDADNGLMIQSQKSTQDPSMVTDWSYLGHSMSFDLCKREIRDKVMVQQVFKRINQYWMDIRTKQVQAILDKRTTGTDPIWATASVDISGQNTPSTMAKRQFVIKVTCKVYVYSETVLLVFETLSQE